MQSNLNSQFQYETGSNLTKEQCDSLLSKNGNSLKEACIEYFSGASYAPNAKADQSLQWVLIGNTRAGKSTFTNKMTETESAVVGKGFGQSTTSTSKAYAAVLPSGSKVTMIDTQGLNDTRGTSNSDIERGISKAVIRGGTKGTIDAVLLFQSCQVDSFGYKDLVRKAKEIFGPSIQSSLVVLFTKHIQNPDFAEEGMADCKKQGLRSFLWESIDISKSKMSIQKTELQQFLENKNPYRLNEAHFFLRKVVEKAYLKQANAPPLVNERVENYTETIHEIQSVTKYKTVTVQVPETKRCGGFGGMMGRTKTVYHSINQTVAYQEPITVPKEVQRSRIVRAETKPPLHQFIVPAKKELLDNLA
ncbi:hypothetical protein FGO68_gene1107 [Halteria grandinella]|uniref:AIG1-type G domain-containing protein n=1 Tax=Halteria grandinella TaxID=5974 RepID=A0A8J8NXF1_HALGN|nr:hypothetical protein FGO68_gene1107 [Halteria grandinella]